MPNQVKRDQEFKIVLQNYNDTVNEGTNDEIRSAFRRVENKFKKARNWFQKETNGNQQRRETFESLAAEVASERSRLDILEKSRSLMRKHLKAVRNLEEFKYAKKANRKHRRLGDGTDMCAQVEANRSQNENDQQSVVTRGQRHFCAFEELQEEISNATSLEELFAASYVSRISRLEDSEQIGSFQGPFGEFGFVGRYYDVYCDFNESGIFTGDGELEDSCLAMHNTVEFVNQFYEQDSAAFANYVNTISAQEEPASIANINAALGRTDAGTPARVAQSAPPDSITIETTHNGHGTSTAGSVGGWKCPSGDIVPVDYSNNQFDSLGDFLSSVMRGGELNDALEDAANSCP